METFRDVSGEPPEQPFSPGELTSGDQVPSGGSPQVMRWHRIALGVTSAIVLLLIGVVIILAGLAKPYNYIVLQNGTECLPDSELRLQLKHFACNSLGDSPAEDVKGCKICHHGWHLHRDKCYWISEEQKSWDKSQEFCKSKNSTLLVIHSSEEMSQFFHEMGQDENTFTKNRTRMLTKTYFWIGLRAEHFEGLGTWRWVDGSPLKEGLFYVVGSAEENSCAMTKKLAVQSENCNSKNRWICEKTAFQV